ncbi:MAG: NADH-quinone oxidoreductase subunit NuoG [Deltaproteobacteria bacterium]|nr:NADH-quinone oxidoreductase subunit NuoG [Deltaproteobacteria bacterium]
MPTLTIDGRAVEVPAGTKVIAAAEAAGIFIPRFCYHPALGSVGACRVCAVWFVDGPVKGLQMSCMVDAQEGMAVSTTHPEALDFRRHVIEWLMMNHPHDCPVCDEGGHCLLQEMTVSGGHSRRRYLGRKRTYRDQDLGPLVQHEMNRCIHCYRCRRFYQEFAGGRDLGALQLASRTYFGRFSDGPLESPFSGNLIDLCPTGVFTDKPARFKGRRWDFERARSICLECSLGCNTTVSARYGEVVRAEARPNPDVNGHFLCDRGRFGFEYANAPDRPRRARIGGQEVSVDEALDHAARRLAQFPPEAVAVVGSCCSSRETLEALCALCRDKGWRGPALFPTRAEQRAVCDAVAGLTPILRRSLTEVECADFALVVGADPLEEAPMLALALRQAWRKGAGVAVLDRRPLRLPFEWTGVPVEPRGLDAALASVLDAVTGRGAAEPELVPIAEALAASRNPVIVCGTAGVEASTPAAAAAAARELETARGRAGLFFLLPAANSFAAASMVGREGSWEALLEPLRAGALRAVLAVEADPVWPAPVSARLDLLVTLGFRLTPTAEQAQVFLPTATVFESGGTWVNQEGRAQRAEAAHRGGTPIVQTGSGGHPPRAFGSAAEGPGARASHALVVGLAAPSS